MSIVQFKWQRSKDKWQRANNHDPNKWEHGFGKILSFGDQYKRHSIAEIAMVMTFTIDAIFISLVNEHDHYLPGYFKYGTREEVINYWLWRAPLCICFCLWGYFLQHEAKQHLASYRKTFKPDGRISKPDSLRRWFVRRVWWFLNDYFGSTWGFLDTFSLTMLFSNLCSMAFFISASFDKNDSNPRDDGHRFFAPTLPKHALLFARL